jgi:predicted acetylornithine/succinylornithine family transaminase
VVPTLTQATPADAALATDEAQWLAPLYPLPRLELARGRGARVWDAAGREYLDFTSGIAVNALGHAPRGLAAAVARQMRELGHCSNLFANRPAAQLARQLTRRTGYDRVFFCNSGTEGVEAALKFARARAGASGRAGRDIVAFGGGFHGRTGFALSATWTPAYREPFAPLVPGIRFGEFNALEGLEELIDEGVAAVIVEPVQGESGAVPATPAFLAALRARATAAGAALIFDEVQCGMGRCGHLLAAEHYGVRADAVVLSKALGGGLPLGAVLLGAGIAEALRPGMHGSTFAGGAPAATAALWTLERVSRPAFLARVRRRARELEAALAALAARHRCVGEARGLGLLRAVELTPDAGFAPSEVVTRCRALGLLVTRGGERAVRLLPPLVVTSEEIREAVAGLDSALTQLETEGAEEP